MSGPVLKADIHLRGVAQPLPACINHTALRIFIKPEYLAELGVTSPVKLQTVILMGREGPLMGKNNSGFLVLYPH